jgi:hypothetical protein
MRKLLRIRVRHWTGALDLLMVSLFEVVYYMRDSFNAFTIYILLLGTHHHTCRPSINQLEAFSGHKRCHGLKYQSIVIPNGLIANLYGPEPGRRHDAFMLKRSGILGKLDEIIGADKLYLYGDSGYPLRGKLITPHLGSNLTIEKRAFNETMSKLRICVEWEFR